ncbi:pilus assembly protein TadG-related protein [Rhizobium sp. SL86]|uniref:pilus assembly protein TadG-related protein n=1 Tax=Rhizobium sp. SL86 TaxID=2995148 RepID=UPI002272E51E|nr:pilus assembly protein TadG-related protein [Rhizobium sp. SL86]MCY1666189.1 pilus assembly protein TadG-related protein [Rhizobium sp. SL86]
MLTALLLPLLLVAAGGSVDLYAAYNQRLQMQTQLDGAMLAAARESDYDSQKQTVTNFLSAFDGETNDPDEEISLADRLEVTQNKDGSLTGGYAQNYPTSFLGLIGLSTLPLSVESSVLGSVSTETSSPASCIYVLGNKSQAVLINSGVNLKSTNCRVDVASTSAPAFIMNGGSTVQTAKFCVKGTNYIKNGGTLTNLEVGCQINTDPYAGQLPEPAVPSTCTTSGVKDVKTITLEPGVHCDVIFNGSPTITFKPGLHIIKGRMIVNSGSTIIANGVTFYFPDVYSELRANGGLTFTGTAPTSGTYKGILMFEKTSNAANNANKQQYVFNGSKGETLEGIIYLPNRDVTYNSTTNQTSRISLVVNTVIMNSSNWMVEPYDGGPSNGGSGSQTIRLTK